MRNFIQCTLCGLLIVCITKGILAEAQKDGQASPYDFGPRLQIERRVLQFIKASERTIRSAPDCDNITTSGTVKVTIGDDLKINCPCESGDNPIWYNAQCRQLVNTSQITILGKKLIIKGYNETNSASYQCRLSDQDSIEPCSSRTDITAVEKVPANKTGVAVFLIILAVILVVFICMVRKYNARISLCLRDTCKPSSGRDGKEYDAYVSLGLTDTDRKFVEGFVSGVLRKKYKYHLLVDEKNLLPKLEYSDKLQSNISRCRRLVVIFSPSYMSHDWCKYCFNEGLRKIVDLNVPTIFIVTDHSVLSELRSHIDIISHIPQILLTHYQTSGERQKAIEKIRKRMPPPMRSIPFRERKGMRSPMLSDAESIHKSDVNLNGNGTASYAENGREYTFGTPPEKIAEDIEREYDEALEEPGPDDFVTTVRTGGDVDPEKVQVHQYGARKDFYSLTMTEDD